MRTTVDLDEKLVEQAFKASGLKKKTELIEAGLRLLVRRQAAQNLIKAGGTMPGWKVPRRRRWPAE